MTDSSQYVSTTPMYSPSSVSSGTWKPSIPDEPMPVNMYRPSSPSEPPPDHVYQPVAPPSPPPGPPPDHAYQPVAAPPFGYSISSVFQPPPPPPVETYSAPTEPLPPHPSEELYRGWFRDMEERTYSPPRYRDIPRKRGIRSN